MANCNYCGNKMTGIPHKCSKCNNTYCTDCRLPENHNCVFHKPETETDKHFETTAPSRSEFIQARRARHQKRLKDKYGNIGDFESGECEVCGRKIEPTEYKCTQCRESTKSTTPIKTDSTTSSRKQAKTDSLQSDKPTGILKVWLAIASLTVVFLGVLVWTGVF